LKSPRWCRKKSGKIQKTVDIEQKKVKCGAKGHKVDLENPILEKEIQGLPLFVGDFLHCPDLKRRISIPSRWRIQVGDPKSLFVLPDFHVKCLNLFPAAEMAFKLDVLRRQSLSDERAMEFARIVGENSDVVSWDTQGRIRIKDKLLDFAEIQDQVALVGAMTKIQVWNPKNRPDSGKIDQARLKEAGAYVGF
jgi:MraZ protein